MLGINKNTIPSKDSLTNKSIGRISFDDPRWKTGEITALSKNRYKNSPSAIDIKSQTPIGNISLDDPRWKTGEIAGIRFTFKRAILNSKIINTDKNDPRWKTGEITPYTKNFQKYQN